jgi:hypothetical protein
MHKALEGRGKGVVWGVGGCGGGGGGGGGKEEKKRILELWCLGRKNWRLSSVWRRKYPPPKKKKKINPAYKFCAKQIAAPPTCRLADTWSTHLTHCSNCGGRYASSRGWDRLGLDLQEGGGYREEVFCLLRLQLGSCKNLHPGGFASLGQFCRVISDLNL